MPIFKSTSPRPVQRRAFTLTEVLVVITIIVVVLAMSVPLFNIFSASRSVDGAENLVSAALQRARARAIGMQERRGLFFFVDPNTGASGMVPVAMNRSVSSGPSSGALILELELDADGQPLSDVEPLPNGVGVALLGENSTAGITDSNKVLQWRPIGLVAFDGIGRLEQINFTVDTTPALPGGKITLASRTGLQGNANAGAARQFSQLALSLYDRRQFDDTVGPAFDYAQKLYFDTATQATWMSENGTAVVINRYNGTVFRGE